MKLIMERILSVIVCIAVFSSCGYNVKDESPTSCKYASYFDYIENGVVVISPYDGSCDTMVVTEPLNNLICMSSSHVAALSAIKADSVITAVSGIGYISDQDLRERWRMTEDGVPGERKLYDIGYEANLDYETIMKIRPDLLLTYTVSGAEPQYIAKLRSLGIPVLVLHDHLEEHPLARAEYIKLFGVITNRQQVADSLFESIAERYNSIAVADKDLSERSRKVLLNIPYGDAWYVPGSDSYMSRLIRDAGGEVLGAEPETSRSKVISFEQAYQLSRQADIWLNPGHCRTREELSAVHMMFPQFRPLYEGLPIYNNTLRTTPEGGNDFWESGAIRPDLVLDDLSRILSGECPDSLNYFFELH